MIKKTVLTVAVIAAACLFAVPAQAQFGKSLKKLGKSVGDVAQATVGDMAADIAANKVATNIVEWMDNNNTVSASDSPYTKRLAGLVTKKYTSVDGLSINYKVYESTEINMIASADGSIRIYSGMMDAFNDDELVALIANQIGHIANKDVRDALMKVATEDNASGAAGAQLEKMLSFSGDKLGSIINELIQVPYTDNQNKKADVYAFDLLTKNGSKTTGLTSALTKMAQMEENDKNAEEDDTLVDSGSSKFTAVNANNAARASLIGSK